MMDDHVYVGDHYENGAISPTQAGDVRQYVSPQAASEPKFVPAWAVWLFAACFLLIIAVLLLDYCVIRRNALGNTCCTRSRQKRNTPSAVHQKRSTNMLLNFSTTTTTTSIKLNRQGQCADQDV
ncbi:hypothetical protein GCK32_008782 [Trichostrongylus colubriformis]|uniref:Uncharacterized protein n=1 Tax=Trichostrongylus colubriformis TaxID=6319 RepID=A0AAN8IF68_TRICO